LAYGILGAATTMLQVIQIQINMYAYMPCLASEESQSSHGA